MQSFVLSLIFGLISLLIMNYLQEARARIEAKEAIANEWCATLLENNKVLKKEVERLRVHLDIKRKASQKIANESANLRADRTKLQNEVAGWKRLYNKSNETNGKVVGLIKELVEDKKNLQMQCENLHLESIKMVKEQVRGIKLAIATQEAKLTAQGEVKKLQYDIASSNNVIHNLEREVQKLRLQEKCRSSVCNL